LDRLSADESIRAAPERDDPAAVELIWERCAGDLIDQMQTALARLPQAQREIVISKVYRDKTFREIAQSLKLSMNTVAGRCRYGMEKLRTLLKDPGS